MARLTLPISMPSSRADLLPLFWWERCCVVLLALATVGYGIVLMAGAEASENRTGELHSALRAGWAVRTKKNIYTEAFTGPPILAALVSPLAQPPAGEETNRTVPWAFAVAASYFFNCLCLIMAIHWLTVAVEAGSADPHVREMSTGCRRWWYARVVPLVVLVLPLSVSLAWGTSYALTLLFIAGMFVNLAHRQTFGAGVLLGGVISLQLMCVFLVLIAIFRRDRLMTMGTVVGLALGMLLLPGLVFGLHRTNELNVQYFQFVKQAGMHQTLVGLYVAATLLAWGFSLYLLNTMLPSATLTGSVQKPTESESTTPRKAA